MRKIKEIIQNWKWNRKIRRWAPAIQKACCDEFFYAMGLTTGQTIYFSSARVCGEWVHLDDVNSLGHGSQLLDSRDREFERGIDVHLSAIAWVADAPHGS